MLMETTITVLRTTIQIAGNFAGTIAWWDRESLHEKHGLEATSCIFAD